jgi:hypothetical protein
MVISRRQTASWRAASRVDNGELIAQGLGRSQQWLHDAKKNRVALQRTANAIRPPTAKQTRNPNAEPAGFRARYF